MLISTRGRYALRFLVYLAENQNENFITTQELAECQGVSRKYAERLMVLLSKGKFVKTQHGKGGGYRLERKPENCKVSEILMAMNEELAPVECLKCSPNSCPRAENCRTLPMWEKLGEMISDFFDKITLADLMVKSRKPSVSFVDTVGEDNPSVSFADISCGVQPLCQTPSDISP